MSLKIWLASAIYLFAQFPVQPGVLAVPPTRAQAADYFSAEQKQIFYPLFKPENLVLPSQAGYAKGSISLTRDHLEKNWLLSLQFSKPLALAQILNQSPRKLLSHFELHQHTRSQAVPLQFQCRRKQKKSSFAHPQLGLFLLCTQVLNTHQGLPLIGVQIYPLQGNRKPHQQMSYTGTEKELKALLASLHPLQGAGPSPVASLDWQQAYTPYYPRQQIAQVHSPGYALFKSKLVWLPAAAKPSLYLNYHKAAVFKDRGVTVHYSLLLKHHSTSQIVKAGFRCQADRKQQNYRHSKWGDYVLCLKDGQFKAHPTARNQKPVLNRSATVFPRKGNKLPHLTLTLHGAPTDILPLLASLKTLNGK